MESGRGVMSGLVAHVTAGAILRRTRTLAAFEELHFKFDKYCTSEKPSCTFQVTCMQPNSHAVLVRIFVQLQLLCIECTYLSMSAEYLTICTRQGKRGAAKSPSGMR